jgi:hypothetical protein
MRKLTKSGIRELANQKNVKSIAVENFLMSMPDTITIYEQKANAHIDASLYRWNMATLNAIVKGIDLAYQEDV